MSGREVDALLRAGGLAPPDAEPSEPADPVEARRYRHPALGDRPVVRLVSQPLAKAEDLALKHLGLTPAGGSEPVAVARRRSLGFPGWVLVHHPEDADTALALVDAMESLARLARSRPGAVKDGYEAIARRLARAVPYFLPTYFEQAGRVFLEAGNVAQAGVMFGKAREAERVYALDVDEERRLAVFVEFALAGALTASSLADYARQLSESADPAAAYAAFRRLCVERTRAGVAPWSEMATQLRRLGRAAGVDLDADERDLLAELLDAPALAKAPIGFWRAYRRPLVELAIDSPAARGTLLNRQPAVPGIHDWWLGMLDSAGALDALIAPAGSLPPEASPHGGAARWLERTVVASTADWRSPGVPDALFALLPRMARRLRADGTTVRMAGRDDWQTDLDLIDLALELRLPVESPAPDRTLHLTRWLNRPAAKRRDLDYVAADPTWGPLLLKALDDDLGRTAAARVLEGGHLRRGFSAWVDRVADRIEGGGLPDLVQEVGRLAKVMDPEALAVNPAARDRILRADAARSLAHTLRGGCLDELGWPALEAARASLGGPIAASGSWPSLVLSDGVRAIVVGPDGILLDHDLRAGPIRHLRQLSFLYTGGQLLVCWWMPGTGRRAYWSGRPAEVFDPRALPTGSWSAPLGLSLELDDGSRTAGSRSVRAGDTAGGAPGHMAADGVRTWALVDAAFRELDPSTGRTGRASLPDFLAGPDAGARLVAESSWVMPLPPGVEGGPLGARDGLVGVRTRRLQDGVFEAERPDGGRVTVRMPDAPVALVTFPGGAAPRPVTLSWQRLTLWDPEGRFRLLQATVLEPGPDLAKATPLVPPPPYWLALRPRDEAGSAALRSLTDEVAGGLLAADSPAQAVETLLPAITDARLRRSVAAQVEVAADAQSRIEKLLTGFHAADTPAGPDDAALVAAFGGLATDRLFHGASPGTTVVRQMAMVERFLETGAMPEQLVNSPIPWALLAGRMAAAAFRAASPATSAEDRATLLAWLERWSETIFARRAEEFRVIQVAEGAGSTLSPATWIRYRGGHRWFISQAQTAHQQPARRVVLERAYRGRFALPPNMTLEWERAGSAWESAERLRRLCALVRERGPAPWVPERVDELARWTGLTRAEAAMLLAGLPGGRRAGQTHLSQAVRRRLDLKVGEAVVAGDRLQKVPVRWRIELAAAAMPDDPADLWKPYVADDGAGPAARMARTWLSGFGRRAQVDESTVAAAQSALRLSRPAAEALAGFSDPDGDSRLNTDGVWTLGAQGQFQPPAGGPDPFNRGMLADVAQLVPWLFAARPVGDPARSGVPEVLARVRSRLASTDLLVDAGWAGGDLGGRPLLDLVAAPAFRPARGAEVPNSRDTGAFVLVAGGGASSSVRVFVRPSRVDAAADAGLLPLVGGLARTVHRRVLFLAGEEADELATRIAATPIAPGGWEANPAASAPAQVVRAAAALAFTPEAAVLYLQLLAAPDPTVRSIREWNGWSGAVFERAAAELVGRGLAVRARRPRAGRDVFLPGPWEELKSPDLPVEAWRLRLYGGRPLGRLLALRPLHRLFEEAWRLVEAGQGPAFEEVAT